MHIEGWNLIDSFYQVVITLSTVGFGEVHELSDKAKIHTSILILMGVGSYAYIIGSFTNAFLEGKIHFFWGKKKMEAKILSLKNHYIVCGYGKIGSIVAEELVREGCDTVVIEKDPEVIKKLVENKMLYIEGDATDDEVLYKAGLKNAKAIITALSTDAQNVYVTLSARQAAPNITIISRAESEESIKKLELAGANRALTPHLLGGLRMAQLVLRPTVINFLDMAIHGNDLNLQMEEVIIPESSKIVGKNLIESQLRPRFNLIIIAIKKEDGTMIYNPQAGEILEGRDTLIVVGKKTDLKKFKETL
jgi:voltage-gated potassium channel